ncbi:hypothetical protein ACTGV6_10530 [Streptococcus suis]
MAARGDTEITAAGGHALVDEIAAPAAPWLMDAEVGAGADGYLSQSALLWDADRRAVAISRQCVVVFA